MNLNAYDNVIEKLDKTKTWIDIKKKQLLSREIKYRPYNCILTRYNKENNTYSYFIAILNEHPVDRNYRHTIIDDYGRVKINLRDIWKKTYLDELKSDCNIVCELVESDEDGEIYSLDV